MLPIVWLTRPPNGLRQKRPLLLPWLTEKQSMTQRCRCHSQGFSLTLVYQAKLAVHELRRCVPVREVFLSCDTDAVVFGHSQLLQNSGQLACWFAGLQQCPLGQLLFSRPDFHLHPLQYARIDARHRLYQRLINAQKQQPDLIKQSLPAQLWARRRRVQWRQEQLIVYEVLLPMVERLGH